MTRYIALLRGINVGGHTVKMEQLRSIFTELGFNKVTSYINSGNIFFDTESSDVKQLASIIEQRLEQHLGYAVPTFLRTIPELETILSNGAFKAVKPTADERFCVVFTNQPIDTRVTLPQHSSKNDIDLVAVTVHEAFTVWRIINGRPPSGTFSETILPAENTTRFYHTLDKILRAAKA